ncbi:MAG TPA: ABC transporter permease [Vicinamibacterales bacterium]|nr:ABC transporter permease [Vicinamibacterales bacterium]
MAGWDDGDFQDEIRSHLAMAERDRIESGSDPETAFYATRKEFGNVTLTTEAARRVWTPRWLESVLDTLSDVRQAIRSLAKSPSFSLIVISVLTIGISLNATVFAVLKGLLVTPLPGVAHSGDLRVVMRETPGGRLLHLSYPDFKFLRDHDTAFSSLMGTMFRLEQYRIGRGAGSRPLSVEFVTGNYFQTLGVRAALGRTFVFPDETAPGRHPIAVLGHGLWQHDFASDPAIVGRTIEINRTPLTVVGVADAAFHGTVPAYDVEVFIPIPMLTEVGAPEISGDRSWNDVGANRHDGLLVAHGFLKPGVTAAEAANATDAIWTALAPERGADEQRERLHILRFWQSPIGPQTYLLPVLSTLSPMGSLVLLIVCANISGLVLARGISRRGDIATRQALGASRSRIVRLLLVETLVLVVPGTLVGLLAAQRFLALFLFYVDRLAAPQRMFFPVELDAITLGFAALIAILCAVVFGLLPALQTSRLNVAAVIKQDGSTRTGPRGRLRSLLVAAQVAVSLVLLVGAGLVGRGLEAASRVDPGFDDRRVIVAGLDLQQHRYTEESGRAFYRDLLEHMRSGGGFDAATLATYPPLAFIDTPTARVTIDGHAAQRGEELVARFNQIGSDYFRTLGIRLAAGRPFDDRDSETAMPSLIVNRTFAERFWRTPTAAIGKRVHIDGSDWRIIVGVAEDVKYIRLNEPPQLYYYLPLPQAYRSAVNLYARANTNVSAAIANVRARISTLDPDLAVDIVQPLSDARDVALIGYRTAAMMLFIFGATGMLLAAMGTYGLVSYTVLQQTREIGIRIALGATRVAVVRAFVGGGVRMAAIGALVGFIAAVTLTRLLGDTLFGVSLTDPRSFVQALAIVMGGVLLATVVPAWRATRTDPTIAIRHQ